MKYALGFAEPAGVGAADLILAPTDRADRAEPAELAESAAPALPEQPEQA
ncbi:hypothetical protein KDL01_08195 [Actinospica durhamensis]|uniref:Uncharacterized protein n=1 Tax=Actinospica durhamensis TaxID=1508375 RepID=A0A941EMH8_9ACTN|nr:hypothetical protein [Actinospica durhamensis]MBR7833242.1 hypothetical protein [Actinospica durhamensis]